MALTFGTAQVFYPQATEAFCKAVLLVDVDPVRLVRGSAKGRGGRMDQYVNDRPYAASSFLSVAIARVFGTAIGGRSKERQALADQPIPLQAEVTPLPCRGDDELLARLFEPLGYRLDVERHLLDQAFPDWGTSPYVTLRLQATCRVADLLSHLYVRALVSSSTNSGTPSVRSMIAATADGGSLSPPRRATISCTPLRPRRFRVRLVNCGSAGSSG